MNPVVPPSEPSSDISPADDVAAPAPVPIQRRALLAAAGLAAMAGIGVAWWRGGAPSVPAIATGGVSGEAAPEGFWTAQWQTPQGTTLDMASLQGKPLLLNFWATWCPPCVEELPLIDAFYTQQRAKGWKVLGLAVDKLKPVQDFLQKNPLAFPVGLAGFAGTDLSRQFGNLSGALPFTVILGADGSVLHRKMGRVVPDELALWAGLK